MRLIVCVLASLVTPVLLSAQSAEVKQYGSWYYQAELDPITDTNTSTALTQDDADRWSLGIQCNGAGGYAVMVMASTDMAGNLLRLEMLGETWNSSMIWRVDRNEPVTEHWITTEYGLGLGDAEKAKKFAEALLLGEERLALRFGHSAKTYTLVLSLDGAREAINALNACS